LNLTAFICKSLRESIPSRLSPYQTVVLAGGFHERSLVYRITASVTNVELSLCSDHEEADTRLLLHTKHAATTHPRIVIQSPDTDVVVLSVAHFQDLPCHELWIKTGTRDKQRFIPIHSIHLSLGSTLAKSLLPFHALTGCDSTSSFSGIGKKRPGNYYPRVLKYNGIFVRWEKMYQSQRLFRRTQNCLFVQCILLPRSFQALTRHNIFYSVNRI